MYCKIIIDYIKETVKERHHICDIALSFKSCSQTEVILSWVGKWRWWWCSASSASLALFLHRISHACVSLPPPPAPSSPSGPPLLLAFIRTVDGDTEPSTYAHTKRCHMCCIYTLLSCCVWCVYIMLGGGSILKFKPSGKRTGQSPGWAGVVKLDLSSWIRRTCSHM